jgi:hypothetical protein
MNNYTCSRVMADYVYYYQYNLYKYDLCMFIRYLVSKKILNLGKIIGVGVEIYLFIYTRHSGRAAALCNSAVSVI